MTSGSTNRPAPQGFHSTEFTDEQALRILQLRASGQRTLTVHQYSRRRHEDDPSQMLYPKRFGSWNRALTLAGLDPIEQPRQLQGATAKWSTEQMLQALTECLSTTGTLAYAGYESWRRAQPKPDALPSGAIIRVRFGRWSNATSRAFRALEQHS